MKKEIKKYYTSVICSGTEENKYKTDGIKLRKIVTSGPNKRYSLGQSDEKVIENISQGQDFEDAVSLLKPWVIQNIILGNYELIFKKICHAGSDTEAKEFIEKLDECNIRKKKSTSDYETIISLLKPYFKNIDAYDFKNKFKADQLKESIEEYKELADQKKNAGESTDYLMFLIKDLESQLKSIVKPLQKSTKTYYAALDEIFTFYVSQNPGHKTSGTLNPRPANSISFYTFLKFCNDFKITDFPSINPTVLMSIFKKNALYHKLMHKDQFFYSLSEISKTVYRSNHNIEMLYKHLGCYSPSIYRQKLRRACLDKSNSEKTIKSGIVAMNYNKKSDLKTKFYNTDNKPIPIFPKTSQNQSKVPITWKVLNETDINSLGEEFDVRDLISDTPDRSQSNITFKIKKRFSITRN
jgi:hypothetical protein